MQVSHSLCLHRLNRPLPEDPDAVDDAAVARIVELTKDFQRTVSLRFCTSITAQGFSHLELCSRLREVDLTASSIVDLSPLAQSKELVSLNVSRTSVRALAPLSGCSKLRTLTVRYSLVECIDGLEHVSSLRLLDIGNTCGIADIHPLRELKLERLFLDCSRVECPLLPTFLPLLATLKHLCLEGSRVDLAEATAQGLPHLEIIPSRSFSFHRGIILNVPNLYQDSVLHGTDVNEGCEEYLGTPEVAESNQFQVIQRTLRAVNRTVTGLHLAILFGQESVVRDLVQLGAKRTSKLEIARNAKVTSLTSAELVDFCFERGIYRDLYQLRERRILDWKALCRQKRDRVLRALTVSSEGRAQSALGEGLQDREVDNQGQSDVRYNDFMLSLPVAPIQPQGRPRDVEVPDL